MFYFLFVKQKEEICFRCIDGMNKESARDYNYLDGKVYVFCLVVFYQKKKTREEGKTMVLRKFIYYAE